MPKLEKMQQAIGKAPADHTATASQMIGALDSWNSLPTMTSSWQTHMVHIRHTENGHDIAQMANIIIKLTIFWSRSTSVLMLTSLKVEAFQWQTFEVTMTW